MADSKSELKKPTLKKVSELRPPDTGLTLTVKVIGANALVPRGRQMRTTECLVGDETGIIVFVSRNDQVDLMKEGNTATLQNAKISKDR